MLAPLFHYCASPAFHSIVSNKCLWLSSMAMSNDSMEGRLLSNIMILLAKQDNVEDLLAAEIKTIIGYYEEVTDPVAICLSGNGDLLSQWRGYAANATGFSIGFGKLYLTQLAEMQKASPTYVQRVSYDQSQQIEIVRPLYEAIKESMVPLKKEHAGLSYSESEAAKSNYETKLNQTRLELMTHHAATIIDRLSALKDYAFHEEDEWRVVSIGLGLSGCSFRSSNTGIIPYREIKLELLKQPPITKVFIGPKNSTSVRVIQRFLESNGFQDVEVVRSALTYR